MKCEEDNDRYETNLLYYGMKFLPPPHYIITDNHNFYFVLSYDVNFFSLLFFCSRPFLRKRGNIDGMDGRNI